MARKALSTVLALSILASGPAVPGQVLFAQTVVTPTYDAGTRTMVPVAISYPKVDKVVERLTTDAAVLDKVPKANVDQVVDLLHRYQSTLSGDAIRPEAGQALEALVKDLSEGKKDPNLAIASFYDRFSEFARDSDSANTFVDVIETSRDDRGNRKQVVAVGSRSAGRTLFIQEATEVGPNSFRKVIRRPNPKDPTKEVVDVVLLETEKGAAREQRIIYNRRIHLLLRNMKKMFYDQCALVRKINNGTADLTPPECKSPAGHYDKNITAAAKAKIKDAYNEKRRLFPEKMLAYLAKLDKLAAAGGAGLEGLDWKELEEVQRLALRFYNDNQVETMQKIVILQITSYFSQVTGTSPKAKKDGTENVDAILKTPEELQKALTKFEEGDLAGYGLLMQAIGATKLSHEDEKYITPELMQIAAEAFANVAYAAKAQKRALQPGMTGEEIDAAIEESQAWLKLAQIQLQSFELHTLSIQLERLKTGQLRDHLGLDDAGMKAEAQRLIDAANGEYLPKLAEANKESKDNLLRQAVGTFHLTYQNAAMAYLYSDTLQERLRTLAAKAGEMKALYLAREFEKVRNKPEYKGSALYKLTGGAYGYFLEHLPEGVAKTAADLDAFSKTLNELARVKSVADIRKGLGPVDAEFQRLVKAMGFSTIPDLAKVKKDAATLGIKHGKVFSATQNFSSNVRIFDLMNELDLYCRKYASPEMVNSDSDGAWSKFISFKWLDSAIDWASGGFAGHSIRQDAVDVGTKLYDKEAFEKLGANKGERQKVLELLKAGKYNEALSAIEKLDPQAAKRAIEEWEADKAEDDPFDSLDFDSFMNKGPQDKALVAAQGVAVGLFGHLQNFIMGYTVASAAYDAVFMTLVTAGLGTMANAAGNAAKMTIAAGRALQAARIAETTSTLARLARTLQSLGKMGTILMKAMEMGGKMLEVGGKVAKAWATNFKNVLGIANVSERLTIVQHVTTVMRIAVPQMAKHTAKTMLVMGIASAGIESTKHIVSPDSSNYKSAGDAAWQGMAGGMAFGAKAGPLLLMNPVQASAFGSGFVGNAVRAAAESTGPVSALARGVARAIPGTARTAVAELGPLGALQKVSLAASPALQTLAKAAVWGGAMFDGALKYWLVSFGSQELAQVGYHYEKKLMKAIGQGGDEKPAPGATETVSALAASQEFSMMVAHTSWLFIPVNTMYSAKDVAVQAGNQKAYSHLMRSGRGQEIERAANGTEIVYEKPWHQWTVSEAFKSVMARFRGKSAVPQGRLEVQEGYREMAARERLKTLSDAELLAIANADRSAENDMLGRTVRVVKDIKSGTLSLLDLAAGGTPGEAKAAAPSANGEAPAGSPLFSKPAKGDAVDLRDLAEVRITNETMAVARELLVKHLRGSASLREAVLAAKGAYTFNEGTPEAVKVEGRELGKLKEIAAMEQIEAGGSRLGRWLPSLGNLKDILTFKPTRTRYEAMVASLKDGIKGETAAEGIRAAKKGMDAIIAAREKSGRAADALALKEARGTIESDAFTEWANARLVEKFEQFRKGEITQEGLDATVQFYVEVWEKGVFGQLFGEKVSDGKGGFVYANIPAEYQVRNQKGDLITSFRPLQKQLIMDVLVGIAKGEKMNFGILGTSGGKTLLGFTLLSFLDAHARISGRKGALFVTTNGDLVAQAMNDYLAFFKGRKPRFRIITYSDLMLEEAMADSMGTPSPYDLYHVVKDEFDDMANKTALSLGSPNGRLSYAKIDPIQEALRLGVEEVWTKLFAKYGGSELNEATFAQMLRENPAMAKEFEALVGKFTGSVKEALETLKSAEYRRWVRDIDSPLYRHLGVKSREQFIKEFGTTPEQVYLNMRAEHQHAFGSLFEVGVITRQHGSVKSWVAKILAGSYQARSMKDLSKVYKRDPDPSRKGIIQYHNDVPLDNLDTAYRSALELKDGLPLTLDFDNVAIVNFRNLNESARRGGGLVVALSGTLSKDVGAFMGKMGWTIRGRRAVSHSADYVVIHDRSAQGQIVGDIASASAAKMPFAEWSKLSEGERPGRRLDIVFNESSAKQESLEKGLDAIGITAERRTVAVTPDSNFLFQERLMPEVLEQKNLEALKSGEADVLILTGQSGFRGLDLPFAAYKGGEIHMHIPNPEAISVGNFKQLVGRIDWGRIPAGTRVYIHGIVEASFLKSQAGTPAYQALVKKGIERVSAGADAPKWESLMDLVAEKLPAGRAAGEQAVAELLKDPVAFKGQDAVKEQALALFGEVLTIRGLREALVAEGFDTPAKAAEAIKSPEAMGRIAASNKVSEALVAELMAEMQQQAEVESQRSSGIYDQAQPIFQMPAFLRRLLAPRAFSK